MSPTDKLSLHLQWAVQPTTGSSDGSHNNSFKRIKKNQSQSFPDSFPFYVALLEELNVFSVIAVIFILNKHSSRRQSLEIAGHTFLHAKIAKAGDKKRDLWRVGVVCFSLTSTPFLRVDMHVWRNAVCWIKEKPWKNSTRDHFRAVLQIYISESENCFKI